MHSWVYRNRARLKLIYGSAPPPALPAAEPVGEPKIEVEFEFEAFEDEVPEGAGAVERGDVDVTLRPMPRRWAE